MVTNAEYGLGMKTGSTTGTTQAQQGVKLLLPRLYAL
jgi:hypothetical protein